MKLNKIKNAKRNMVIGIILKIYQILLPFLFRTVIVYTLGVNYLGLNSLFTSILQVLNLAELGVGSAMIFSMYKPIAEDDEKKICALMNLYRKYYNIIGLVILVIGILLTPFIPKLINGEVPKELNIYILYIMNLIATVLSYWLLAYRNSVLQAHQRLDVSSKITIVTDSFKYFFQLVALYFCKNYYLYVLAILITQLVNNIITAHMAKKMYPNYNPEGCISKNETIVINHRIRDLFTSKLGGVIVNSADTIVISAFLGLKILAIYQNYFYIISAIMGFITVLNNSVLAGIGNSMIVKSKKENYEEFRVFVFLEMWILAFCTCCFSSLFQNFMTLWMGPDLLLDYPVVILLCIYFIGYEYVMLMSVYKDAGGIWHEDRFRPLISGIANIILNMILVNFVGLYGIVLSTIISIYCISAPWITKNVFNLIFVKDDIKDFLKTILKYLVTLIFSVICVNICCAFVTLNSIVGFIIRGIITLIISNGIFILAYMKNPMLKKMVDLINRKIFKRGKWI